MNAPGAGRRTQSPKTRHAMVTGTNGVTPLLMLIARSMNRTVSVPWDALTVHNRLNCSNSTTARSTARMDSRTTPCTPRGHAEGLGMSC